ncbi:FAD-binding oxidoreductase [Nakamurella flavida]|uniref:FAD-binding oxidoreductase n=1 Tax=Nakamurella flavida TaxID=363630 RepID=A0A938YFZ5_9ACTN|nr:FAD-binding and (Fe-S)-binding domain-containing protein [Nakamurella flavida]MBM9476975.1 FAD-binding oxidoreductase [Nakamurella flavida]MDP9779920.1 FAD/FMN-containing dehydrogenase/Fe-S oxidoreductase [Nakamurella flavida]
MTDLVSSRAPDRRGDPEPALVELRRALGPRLDTAPRRLAEYSSDASNYRVVPTAVVFPADADDVVAVLEVAGAHGLPVTARGGGTSVAGNAVGPGVVLDLSRHLHRIEDIDPVARTARVQPGVVLADVQRAAGVHGLRFGPDPSTHARCTLGGMIGNNACGPHAVAWGRTADNVRSLDVLDGRGRRLHLAPGSGPAGLDALIGAHLAVVRTEFGRFGRQVSGYSLEHLLPENGRDAARAFVGTEGTCGIVLQAEVDLVPVPAVTALVVLGYPDMPSAADAVPALLAQGPLAIEGMDARLVDVVRRHHGTVPELPAGRGWLFVEVGGETTAQAADAARRIVAGGGTGASRVVPTGPETRALWRIREDGVGLAGRTPDGRPAWPGWEDAAVPPASLGAYLRDFAALMADHGVDGLTYGHFGDGCVHARLDLPIGSASHRFRAFLVDAAVLVARYGGSMSGEHGDGRARGELLPHMYSPAARALFADVKALYDPLDILNPGIVVRPAPLDDDLRLVGARPSPALGFSLLSDDGDLSTAVHRCVGVGKCRADTSAAGGFMCPSYLATKDEKDSTRGRARVLQEMVNGTLVRDGARSAEVAESLDLCLSCKACASDCPAGVDMATYKAEVLFRRYHRRLRPVAHYALGWLPRWTRVVDRLRLAPVINALAARPALRSWGFRAAGVDTRRSAPVLAPESLRRWWRSTSWQQSAQQDRPPVLLWTDSFTDAFTPQVGRAALEVLRDAGFTVTIPARPVCCGLTWITTGQLPAARKRLRHSVDTVIDHVDAGGLIVGLEPSCTAVLRSDLTELLAEDPRAARVAAATRTLAEVLTQAAPDWKVPDLGGGEVVVQPHCHQHAVLGFDADRSLLERGGVHSTEIAGCCGLAGNFGMERGHYDVSVAVAENGLLPALRDHPDVPFVADGFSCRTQAEQLAGRPTRHLAELLADGVRRRDHGSIRPSPPGCC